MDLEAIRKRVERKWTIFNRLIGIYGLFTLVYLAFIIGIYYHHAKILSILGFTYLLPTSVILFLGIAVIPEVETDPLDSLFGFGIWNFIVSGVIGLSLLIFKIYYCVSNPFISLGGPILAFIIIHAILMMVGILQGVLTISLAFEIQRLQQNSRVIESNIEAPQLDGDFSRMD